MANQPLSRLRKLQEEAQAMLDEKDLVLQDEHRLPRTRRFLHFWLLVGKSFVRNRCPVRAAALAYTTLLALVPLLAVIVSVTTGFLKQEEGKEQIRVWIQTSIDKFAPQIGLAEVAEGEAIDAREQVVSKIITYVENFRSGTLGVTAVLVLVFVAISLLSSIEATFNDMWGVAQGRRWVSRVIHYWAALTLGPLFLLVAAGFANLKNYTAAAVTPDELNAQAKLIERTLARNQMPASLIGVTNTATMAVFEFRARTAAEVPRIASLSNQLAKVVRAHKAPFISPVSGTDRFVIQTPLHDRKALMLEQLRHVLDDLPFISLLTSHVLPIVILTVMFGVFYLLMPNTKVHWKAAVAGGLAAGLLLHLNASFNTIYVSRVVTYSKVYGSLGLVPIFLIGLYFSWLIVLFGGQVAYAMQNRKAYLQEKLAESINHRGREFVALRMMTLIGQRFSSGERAPTAVEMAQIMEVPMQLICQIARVLLDAKLVVEVVGAETGYTPARPLEQISAHDILQALRMGHGQDAPPGPDDGGNRLRLEFETIHQAEKEVAASMTLKHLVERTQTKAEVS